MGEFLADTVPGVSVLTINSSSVNHDRRSFRGRGSRTGSTLRRPHPQALAAPFLEFDLARELEQLHREHEWDNNGQNAMTLVKGDEFRIVLTALKAHRKIPGHQTDGRLSIQAVSGHVRLRAEGRTFDRPVGRIVALYRGLAHELDAVAESAVLLTIVWPTEAQTDTVPPPM